MTPRSVRVLVLVASRHGATAEIGAEIGRCLTAGDHGSDVAIHAVVTPVELRPDPEAFDAVVIGSAVYAGRWLAAAREYTATHAGTLRARPVWLFSSGPIGERPFPPDLPSDVGPLSRLTAARGHALFPGRLDPARLTLGERALVTAMRAPLGDFRDWPAVRAWAAEIAAELAAPAPVPG